MLLRKHYNQIILADRLKALFKEYKHLVLLNNPILSFMAMNVIEDTLILDDTTKKHVLSIIKKKKELDLKALQRNDKYKIIVRELLNKKTANIRSKLVECVLYLSTELFPQLEKGKYRIISFYINYPLERK